MIARGCGQPLGCRRGRIPFRATTLPGWQVGGGFGLALDAIDVLATFAARFNPISASGVT